MSRTRALAWSGLDDWLAEHATIELGADGLRARGVQLGIDPEPYRAEYELVAEGDWITRSLTVEVSVAGGRRRLELVHDGEGRWSEGEHLDGALDCDLAFSPLTNLMPVRRHRFHEQPGTVDFVMAWVSLPDLTVTRAEQRYEHVRLTDAGSVVRFRSIGEGEGFVADLELDADGLVVVYPQLARRVGEAGG